MYSGWFGSVLIWQIAPHVVEIAVPGCALGIAVLAAKDPVAVSLIPAKPQGESPGCGSASEEPCLIHRENVARRMAQSAGFGRYGECIGSSWGSCTRVVDIGKAAATSQGNNKEERRECPCQLP